MKILAVVVLYKTTFAASQTIASLAHIFGRVPELVASVDVLIWDNSPDPVLNPHTSFPFLYHHSHANVGLSGAYNRAASVAQEEGTPWLLLLDQDTTLPSNFLAAMLQQAAELESRREIAAIVPAVFVGDHRASPWRVLFNSRKPYPLDESGIADGELAAINSGCMLRLGSLLEIGGYSEAFWLDYSDLYVFHRFYRNKLRVWRASDIRIQHSMTILDYDNLMSTWRYGNFIEAEGAFNDIFHGRLENAFQTARLLVRVFRQRKRFKNREFSRITLRYFLKRLLHTRSQRIRAWERSTAERTALLGASTSADSVP
jgi:GT2 family glycosyltransferase